VKVVLIVGSVCFSITGKNTAGDVLPLGEPDLLNCSCDKDNTLGLAYGLCNVT